MAKVNVNKFVRFLVSLTNDYAVNEDGYIVNKLDDDPIVIGSAKKQVMVMDDMISDPDCVVLNPTNETLRESMVTRWMYANIITSFTTRICSVLTSIIDIHNNGDDADVSPKMMTILSKHIGKVDGKTEAELTSMISEMLDFMNIVYVRKMRTGHFRCGLFDESRDTVLKGVKRKKTATMVTNLFGEILGSADGNEIRNMFSHKSTLLSCPKLDSILNVLMKLYDKVNHVLAAVTGCEYMVVDLTEMAYHINHLDEYYQHTKWFTGSAATSQSNAPVPIEPAAPKNATGIPMPYDYASRAAGANNESTSFVPNGIMNAGGGSIPMPTQLLNSRQGAIPMPHQYMGQSAMIGGMVRPQGTFLAFR